MSGREAIETMWAGLHRRAKTRRDGYESMLISLSEHYGKPGFKLWLQEQKATLEWHLQQIDSRGEVDNVRDGKLDAINHFVGLMEESNENINQEPSSTV